LISLPARSDIYPVIQTARIATASATCAPIFPLNIRISEKFAHARADWVM
jgi:hypothetical protein